MIDSSLLKVQLFPHQIDGIQWMLEREKKGGGILADDMGLGKTLQTLTTIVLNKSISLDPRHHTTLVVAPLAVISNWKKETEKLNVPLNVLLYHGQNKSADFHLYDIVVTTYTALSMNYISEQKKGPLLNYHWYRIVLDESHIIKNRKTKTAQAAFCLRGSIKWCLSGTPFQNRLGELYSNLRFLDAHPFNDFEYFRYNGHQLFITPPEENKTSMWSQICLRRTKDILNLPSKYVDLISLDFSDQEKGIYSILERKAQEEIALLFSGGLSFESFSFVLTHMLRLRQACDHPLLAGVPLTNYLSIKMVKTCHLIGDIIGRGEKVLVYSQFNGMLDFYAELFTKANVPFVMYTGSQSINSREQAKMTFNDNPNVKVCLISTKAGGVGLTMTAANNVILTEPWWNPFVDEQAIDRTHRLGQKRQVNVYKLTIKDSFEERMLELQAKKRDIFDQLINGTVNGRIKGKAKFSEADIKFLFKIK